MKEKRSGSVLVVSGSEKGRESLVGMLPRSTFGEVAAVSGAGEAKRLLLRSSYDIVVINTPLSDEYGLDFAINIVEDSTASAMVLVKSDAFEQAADKVEDYGVLALAKPVTRQSLLQALRLMAATRQRLRALEKENLRLKDKMEEVRIVNRAKWLLIENEGLTEAQAHRKIEKLAMDTRQSRKAVAGGIIDNYQL